jgi:predicted DNA-binding protein
MKKKWQDVKFETVTVRMPGELSIKLAAESVKRKTTKAELVREAVDEYFNKDKTARCTASGRKG